MEYLIESLKHIEIAERMIKTYRLIYDNKLLIKIFNEIYKSLIFTIKGILKSKKSKIFENDIKNIDILFKLKNRDVMDNKDKILSIINIKEKYKKSVMEFSRKESIIMMEKDLNLIKLNLKDLINYLKFAKSFYLKASINANF